MWPLERGKQIISKSESGAQGDILKMFSKNGNSMRYSKDMEPTKL
jgi:hypothetical protein